MADRRRSRNVENPEQQKRERLVQRFAADEEKHDQERDDLVDHDASVVRTAKVAAGDIGSPRSEREQQHDDDGEYDIVDVRSKQRGNRNRDQRPERAWRPRRETAAETKRD